MNTAHDQVAAAPSARTTSTMPAAIATGNVPAWIQPRHVGFNSTCELVEAASMSGSWGSAASSGRVLRVTVRAYAPAHAAAYIRGGAKR